MTAVLGGLATALAFTCTSLLISRATELIPAFSVAASAMLIGLVMVVPFVLVSGVPRSLDATSAGWLLVSGVANVAGFLTAYSALGLGQIGAVTPIVSTEGAFAAVFAIIGGEHLGMPVAVSLAVIVLGVILAASSPQHSDVATVHHKRALTLALFSAVAYGLTFYSVGKASASLPIVWVLLPARLVGVLLVTLPLALRGQLVMTRRALPYVSALAFLELIGLVFYAYGSRQSLAVTAVLASQFAAFATVVAALFFHERLMRPQIAGLATIVVGVTALSALHP
jgi:bacterial/archaeal transporter family protein